MPVKHSRHVALTESLARFIDRQVAEGRYATASEVMRAALRLLIEKDEAGRPNPRPREAEPR
jgi:antitoxin ParD1/3/4